MRVDVRRLLDALRIDVRNDRGEDLWAPCPLPGHEEKEPSWHIEASESSDAYGAWHCLAGETSVITIDGRRRIDELSGSRHTILARTNRGRPRWVEATFASYGVQELSEIHLSRNGVEEKIRATADHRWFVRGGRRQGTLVEKRTAELRTGDRLFSIFPAKSPTLSPSRWGIAHGFVFGDGWLVSDGSTSVDLWDAKDAAMMPFFQLSRRTPVTSRGQYGGRPGVRVSGLPGIFKSRPDLGESPSYLYGWLAGYFAADGCVAEDGWPMLTSASRSDLEYVENVCLKIGVVTHPIRCQKRVGLGQGPTDIYRLTFSRRSLSREFFVLDHHASRWSAHCDVKERLGWVVDSVELTSKEEEVFCAVVPEHHCFALDGYILTGNCFGCKEGGGPVDLVMAKFGHSYKGALEWIKRRGLLADEGPVPLRAEVVVDQHPRQLELPREVMHLGNMGAWPTPFVRRARQRGLIPKQVERWGAGVAVDGTLAGRIVFPVVDEAGKLANYTARTILRDGHPRYLSGSIAEGADPGAVFGSRWWPVEKRRARVYVTEGALNALSVERAVAYYRRFSQHSGQTCIASLDGSEVVDGQVIQLAAFGEVVVVKDPDRAGEMMAEALATLARRTRVVEVDLPRGDDANDVEMKRGRRELASLVLGR